MPYDAITLDTNTVMQNGFHFEGGLLAQMEQFKGGSTRFVLSDIVVREIAHHLTVSTRSARDSLTSALKKALEAGLLDGPGREFADSASALPAPRDTARARLRTFIEKSGGEIITADAVQMKELIALYFDSAPPFEAAGRKKSEFPDAIALLSLQHWATSQRLRLLAVSQDEGWTSFARGRDWIDVVKDLGDALKLLQSHTEQAEAFVRTKFDSIRREPGSASASRFVELLSEAVGDMEPYGSAEAGYSVEVDSVELDYAGFRFTAEPEHEPFDIVQVGAEKIVVRTPLLVHATAKSSLSFDVWDSVDREYVTLGGARAQTEADIEADFLITFEGGWSDAPEDAEVAVIEWVEVPEIDFGYVEPDFSDPDEFGSDEERAAEGDPHA